MRKSKKEFRAYILTGIFFLAKLNLLAIPLYLIIFFNLSYLPLQTFVASVNVELLKSLGYTVSQNENLFTINTLDKILRVQVSWDSTGWKSLYAIATLILATPVAGLSRKLKYLAFSLPSIFLINVMRIFSTVIFSLTYGLQYFDFIHSVLWRATIIVSVLALWTVFLIKEKDNIVKNQPITRRSWTSIRKLILANPRKTLR